MADENQTVSTRRFRTAARTVALIADILLCLAGVAASTYLIVINEHPTYRAISAATVVALIANLIYAMRGYRKADASKYRVYMLFSAIAMFILTTGTCSFSENQCGPKFAIFIGMDILSVCLYLILFCAKDLGAPASVLFSLYNVAHMTYNICYTPEGSADFIVLFSLLVLSVIGFLMVIGKYLDKAERKAAAGSSK